MPKMTTKNFSKAPYIKIDINFRTDREDGIDIANAQPCDSIALLLPISVHGDFSSNYGATQHISISSRFDLFYHTARLWYFITIP